MPFVTNSAHLSVSASAIWEQLRCLHFVWNPRVMVTHDILPPRADSKEEEFVQTEKAPGVGATRLIVYVDQTQQRIRVTGISDSKRTISWELLSSNVPLTYSGVTHSVTVSSVTTDNTCFVEWTSEFSRDASLEALQDAKFKQLENFKQLEAEAKKEFTWFNTAEQVAANVDMKGKTVLITGANSGLGFESARVLVGRGAHVVITCRDEKKASEAVTALNKNAKNGGQVTGMVCCLDSFTSIRAFAQAYIKTGLPIHVLMLNAGVMACLQGQTEEKFESQIGVNHFGHFLLAKLLLPVVKATAAKAPCRIVVLSSRAHIRSDVNLDDINWTKTAYDKWKAYGASKTANILFAVQLNKQLGQEGFKNISVTAVHPGPIATNLGRHLSAPERQALRMFRYKTEQQGASTQVWAAVSPRFASNADGGVYLADNNVDEPMPYARDLKRAESLWQLTEKLIADVSK